jgi:hypothetical protein
MTTLTQAQEVFQVFHYLHKTLTKLQSNPHMDLARDLQEWGHFFAPNVQHYLHTDIQVRLQSVQHQWDGYDLKGMIDYSLLSMRMIVEENENAHDAITDQLDDIWYNHMDKNSIAVHNATLGPVLSQLCGIVYDERKQRATLTF